MSHTDLTPIWLVSGGHVLCSALLATRRRHRRRGLRGTTIHHEPLVIDKCHWVHSIGMKYSLDVAFLDANNTVIEIHHVRPWRIDRPVRHAIRVLEAPAGSFERWSLHVGDVVDVRHVN
jgi:uncharacterized protein